MRNYIILLLLLIINLASSAVVYGDQTHRYLITTATSGLGRAICENLAAEGHELILGGRSKEKLDHLKLSLEKAYQGQYTTAVFDYTDLASIQKLGDTLKTQKLDGVVLITKRPTIDTKDIPSAAQWLEMFSSDFVAPLEIIQQALPALQMDASIVVIAGSTSVYAIPNYYNSNVLRKMWIAEIKNLVYQLKSRKIRSNAISPGIILTNYHKERVQQRATEANKTFDMQVNEEANDIPLQRFGTAIDVAKATAFLLSPQSKHINGINLVMDGGLNKGY